MTIGVTDFIKIGEVRQEIDSAYPNPGEDVESGLAVPNNGYSHRLVGHAFEFLCRALLYRRCNEVILPEYFNGHIRWTGDNEPPITVMRFDGTKWEEHPDVSSQEEWDAMQEDLPVWERQRSSVRWAEDEELTKIVHQYIQTGMNTDGVVRAALINAGWKPDGSVQSWIDRAAFESDILGEMEELFELLRDSEWTDSETVIDQPEFGDHRYVLPGEGDLIVDDMLIDIKTTEQSSFTNQFWRQLLLYYVLCDVQRILFEEMHTTQDDISNFKYPEINRVGIYFARYGKLKTIDMNSVISDQERYDEFRAWIIDRSIEENRHAQKNYDTVRNVLTDPYDFKRQQTFSDF